MPEPLSILVGTMTGAAELVAFEVEQTLSSLGYAPRVEMMERLSSDVFRPGGVFLIVCSTYGNGDVPDNARSLFASLERDRPDLSNVVYGVVALGDTTYRATFCNGGLRFDRLLAELGAHRAGEIMKHDASSGTLAEDVACQWASDWAQRDLALARAA